MQSWIQNLLMGFLYQIIFKFQTNQSKLNDIVKARKKFQLFCRDLNGKTHTLNVNSDTSIDEIHESICGKMGITDISTARDSIYLVCCRPLMFGKSLSDYGISAETTIHATGRLR